MYAQLLIPTTTSKTVDANKTILEPAFTDYELVDIAFQADVGQVGHHVGHDLEARVLAQVEALADGAHRVAAVRIARYVLYTKSHIQKKKEKKRRNQHQDNSADPPRL